MTGPTPTSIQHADRTALQRGLREAEVRTLAQVARVRDSLRRAVDAVAAGDVAAADALIRDGEAFQQDYGDVHDCLLALIARQSPVAGDLRVAIALVHVNDRAERMAAQCLNVAKLCSRVSAGERPAEAQLECIAAMARLADEQVQSAGRVFAERDVEGAARLREHDLGINEHNRRCFALAVQDGTDEARREVGFFVALMARALERIGDNAVDIAQQAVFAETGRLRPDTGH